MSDSVKKKLSVDEFVHKLHEDVTSKEGNDYVFFLGAGCSVTSGIPTAARLTTKWMDALMREKNLPSGECVSGYDENNPAASYGEVFKALCGPRQRQEEIESVCRDAWGPSFGYAVLATLLDQIDNFKFVLTTNFDDLLADAFHWYTNMRPVVIRHASLARFIQLHRPPPTIIKMHGDQHFEPLNTATEIEDLPSETQAAVYDVIRQRGIIFVGYAGNDRGVASVLNVVKQYGQLRDVFWINTDAPGAALVSWLKAHQFFWVDHLDFDKLMLRIQQKFTLPYPARSRPDPIFHGYARSFLLAAARFTPSEDLDLHRESVQAVKDAGHQLERIPEFDWFYDSERAAEFEKSRRWELVVERAHYGFNKALRDADGTKRIYEDGIRAVSGSFELLIAYGDFLRESLREESAATDQYWEALRIAPDWETVRARLFEDVEDEQLLRARVARALNEHVIDVNGAEQILEKDMSKFGGVERRIAHGDFFLSRVEGGATVAIKLYWKAFEQDREYKSRPWSRLFIDVDDWMVIVERVRDAFASGLLDGEGAKRAFDDAVARPSPTGDLYVAYGDFLRDLNLESDNKLQEPVEQYRKALEVDPTHAQARSRLFVEDARADSLYESVHFAVRKRLIDTAEAEQIFAEAVGRSPGNADMLIAHAKFLEDENRDLQGAFDQYLAAYAIKIEDIFVRDRLDQLAPRCGRVPPWKLEELPSAAPPQGEADWSAPPQWMPEDQLMNPNEPTWIANATDDVVLSMHPLAAGAWRRVLLNDGEVHLRELVIETPPQSWHITEPRTSAHWTTVDHRIEAQLQELERIAGKRVHVFANAPYALGALLGNRLAQRLGRGWDLVFYQFNAATKAWEDWGPNRRLLAPVRSEPLLHSTSAQGAADAAGARHVVVAVHISRQASQQEIGRALVDAGAEGAITWIDVTPVDGNSQSALLEPAAVDRCVHDLDEILFRAASEHPAAELHVFYVGPLSVLMRAAAKLHLLPRPATLYERIQVDGNFVFVPGLDLVHQKLLMGPQPAKTTAATPAGGPATSAGALPPHLRVLAVATEWESKKGGLSTFNRLLCRALAQAGHEVSCLVPEVSERERKSALDARVRLVAVSEGGAPEAARLFLRPANVELAPTVVIGHGRVTGDAAFYQSRTHFLGSLLVHFVHTAPDYIEWFKGDELSEDASRKADERRKIEIGLAAQADLVTGVGPVLTRWIRDELHVGALKSVPIHRFDPGLSGIARVRARPETVCILLLGRAEDRRLKGIDIAVQALARLPERPPELTIRGVPEGGAREFGDWVASLAPKLNVRAFAYVSDQETIEADIRKASVVLMPSRSEGFGLVGLEAISAGVPVLVSDRSGLGEVLREVGTPSALRAVVATSGADDEADITAWSSKIGYVLHNRDAAYMDAAKLLEELTPELDWKRAVEGLVAELRKVAAARVAGQQNA